MGKDERGGWHWPAFILGPFWYLSKGIISKGIWLLVLCILTLFCAVPFVWIYCGAKGKDDWYEYRLQQKGRFNLDNLA